MVDVFHPVHQYERLPNRVPDWPIAGIGERGGTVGTRRHTSEFVLFHLCKITHLCRTARTYSMRVVSSTARF